MAEPGEGPSTPGSKAGGGWWAAVTKVVAQSGEVMRAAQELLQDQELRSKGISLLVSGAQNRVQGIQRSANRLGDRVQSNLRRIQAFMANVEDQMNTSIRKRQLQLTRKQPVDVQLGREAFVDVPQEVRARLWYVLLENPHLAAHIKCEQPGPVPNRRSEDDAPPRGTSTSGRSTQQGATASRENSGGLGPRAASPARQSFAGKLVHKSTGSSSSLAAVAAATLGFKRLSSGTGAGGGGGGVAAQGQEGAGGPGGGSGSTSRKEREPSSPFAVLSRLARTDAAPAADAQPPTPGASGPAGPGGASGDTDGWEIVDDLAGGGMLGGPFIGGEFDGGMGMLGLGAQGGGGQQQQQPEGVLVIRRRLEAIGPIPLDESGSDPALVAQQAVLEAMLQVPWEPEVGLPTEVSPECRFAMLNEMTAGQEEVDDSILRDIHRTFPEHPYFGLEAGQKSLFRVLKAYSLHDLEVAYCQGMAFMAGVMLMFVPEEMAFRLFCRLMDPEGPNLRRYYVPGLEPLKAELATFELLLTWRFPELGTHLAEYGLPPVLYCSQWLMTLFATPFPPAFCARVIDVLLQDGHDRLLLRCSCAIMEVLEEGLLRRNDFEALITYLKMEPLTWNVSRQRAIMERALTSPITDAEIDVARDTVTSRAVLAATLGGAQAGEGAAGLGGGGAGATVAVASMHAAAAAAAEARAAAAGGGGAAGGGALRGGSSGHVLPPLGLTGSGSLGRHRHGISLTAHDPTLAALPHSLSFGARPEGGSGQLGLAPRASIDLEVEAALTAAAAVAAGEDGAAATRWDGADGVASGLQAEGGGHRASGSGAAGAAAAAEGSAAEGCGATPLGAAAGAAAAAQAGPRTGDLLSFDEPPPADLPAAPRTSGWGAGAAGSQPAAAGPDGAAFPSAHGSPDLLLDGFGDLGIGSGLGHQGGLAEGAGVGFAGDSCGLLDAGEVGGGAAADTQYDGEYGEMLMDVGLLLPPVGEAEQVGGQGAPAHVGDLLMD